MTYQNAAPSALAALADPTRRAIFERLAAQPSGDFANVGALAGNEFDLGKVKVEVLNKPHRPSGLPTGRMAIYCFFLNGQALRVGLAGPNSGGLSRCPRSA